MLYLLILIEIICKSWRKRNDGSDKQYEPDLILDLGDVYTGRTRTATTYNVSRFLRDYASMGSEWHKRLDTFMRALDEKVKVDPTDDTRDPEARDIRDGIEHVIRVLQARCESFKGLEVVKTGSFYAGVRVGRPYEADILLVNPINSSVSSAQLLEDICKHEAAIDRDLNHRKWMLVGRLPHKAGFNLTLLKPDTSVGLLIDFVAMYKLNERTVRDHLSDQAKQLLDHDDDSSLYTMFHEHQIPDLRYVHFQILKKIPPEIKTGYRVAKYFLNDQLATETLLLAFEFHQLKNKIYPSQIHPKTYGCQAIVKSYTLQLLFLNLYLKASSEMKELLKHPALLTLCLLDMLTHTCQQMTRGLLQDSESAFELNNVVARPQSCVYQERFKFVPEKIKACGYTFKDVGFCSQVIKPALQLMIVRIFHYLSSDNLAHHLSLYGLVNTPNKFICENMMRKTDFMQHKDIAPALVFDDSSRVITPKTVYERLQERLQQWQYKELYALQLTGLFQGATPEQLAKAYDCRHDSREHTSRCVYNPAR